MGEIKSILGNNMPKENMHYTCIACMTIDSVMRIDKKTIHKFILKSKYRLKKILMSRFINTELKSDSDSSDSDSEKENAKFDAELRAKLKSGSDNDSHQ